jgi:hypothetical protein
MIYKKRDLIPVVVFILGSVLGFQGMTGWGVLLFLIGAIGMIWSSFEADLRYRQKNLELLENGIKELFPQSWELFLGKSSLKNTTVYFNPYGEHESKNIPFIIERNSPDFKFDNYLFRFSEESFSDYNIVCGVKDGEFQRWCGNNEFDSITNIDNTFHSMDVIMSLNLKANRDREEQRKERVKETIEKINTY